jgi:predicted enzyme related to lactoylglutathione lyase
MSCRVNVVTSVFVSVAAVGVFCRTDAASAASSVAVSPQYDTTHVYVAPEDFDRFTASLLATFGGSKSQRGIFQVTPTPSQTMSQLIFTPAGTFSVFGFKTPVPYPFGIERTGYLVQDMDFAVQSARRNGADVTVATFADPIGRDAIIEWPGGVHMQLYWHTTAPNYAALQTIPENRVYVSPGSASAFIRDFVGFAGGHVTADEPASPGVEIGDPGSYYRSVTINSGFGKVRVLVTNGHLPYPYGRETTGYEVSDLTATLDKAKASGAKVLVEPYSSRGRAAALVQFPGGYIAEIHSSAGK